MSEENITVEGEEVIDRTGEDAGNLDLNSIAGLLKNVDISQLLGLINSVDIGQLSSLFGFMNSGNSIAESGKSRNREIEILSAIKPMVNSQRGELIDMILQIYAISRILK